ncbi:MAG: putative quinol monooxygenase [Myxococcales bacterium]|nr:antibiotic biosynthesis monooxygenase [Myxococcales bacterium]HIK84955.1 antibiotic biosynthesis monooxygenase [Myxococcales bacterium]
MIIVLVEVESSVEAIAGMREALVTMQAASRAEEGCQDYTFCQEVGDPNQMRIVEIWESMDALRFHFGTPHMAAFREVMASSPPASMNVKVHELGAQLEMPS